MTAPPPRGIVLVELLVALLLVGVASTFLLTALLDAARLDRRLTARRRVDGERRAAVASASADSSCRRTDLPPSVVELVLPAEPGRPALTVAIRCGR